MRIAKVSITEKSKVEQVRVSRETVIFATQSKPRNINLIPFVEGII